MEYWSDRMHFDPTVYGWKLSELEREAIRKILTREQLSDLVRQVVTYFWLTMPEDRRSVSEVCVEVRALVEEVLKQFERDVADL